MTNAVKMDNCREQSAPDVSTDGDAAETPAITSTLPSRMVRRAAMSGEELVRLASAAYGPEWKMPVAALVGRSREMLWRYETEYSRISDDLAKVIRKACLATLAQRVAEMSAILAGYLKGEQEDLR